MTLQQLSYIVAVDTYRNFVTAAKHCFVSQPALSMQIRKLEQDLGIELFDRSKQPILATEAGRRVIEQARVILREAARVQDIVDVTRQEISGEFRLGAIPTVSPYLFPLFLQKFCLLYPKVQLIIEEMQTAQIIDRLHHDQLDAAILATPLGVSMVRERPLYREPFTVYVAQHHPLFRKHRIEVADLHLEDLWLLHDGHCLRDQIVQLCGERKRQPNEEPARMRFEAGNLETLKKLVEQDFGVTLLPYLAALEVAEEHRSLIREFRDPKPVREISLVYERASLKQHIIDALAETIVESLPEEMKRVDDSDPLPPKPLAVNRS